MMFQTELFGVYLKKICVLFYDGMTENIISSLIVTYHLNSFPRQFFFIF